MSDERGRCKAVSSQVGVTKSGDSEITNTILDRLQALHNEIVSMKTESKVENKNIIDSIAKMETNMNSGLKKLENDFLNLKRNYSAMKELTNKLSKEIDSIKLHNFDQKNFLRSNNIRIANVHFNENEDLFSIIKIISDTVHYEIDKNQLDFYYRLPSRNNKPRPILLRFLRQTDKTNFLKSCRINRSLLKTDIFSVTSSNIPVLPVYVSESMTKESYELFTKGKHLLKAGLIKFLWYRNGILRARKLVGSPAVVIRRASDFNCFYISAPFPEDDSTNATSGDQDSDAASVDSVIIGGDFNARVGSLNSLENEMFESSSLFANRCSQDPEINSRGVHLVNVMEDYGFVLCNGRTHSDTPANYTYFSKNGCSTLDLIWVSIGSIHIIHDLLIENICFISDHCCCTIKLNINDSKFDKTSFGQTNKENYINVVNRSNDNFLQFYSFLNNSNNIYFNSDNIEELYNNFYETV
ncbi:hypothetical protein O3M35_012043 [Rhynocoris fuscipes]|uniref:Endonuclease/exonuclease/phosphatase domain-containing protein n=1 Tax=Rhynocoris fuscipes TaxID=488301 RepID=A0AAW1CTI0_9HEMI